MSANGMHPELIKAAIRMKYGSLSQFALDHNFSEGAARKALTKPMPGIEPAIAYCIGKSLHEIWPDRYDKNNLRKRPLRERLLKKKRTGVTQKSSSPSKKTKTENGGGA